MAHSSDKIKKIRADFFQNPTTDLDAIRETVAKSWLRVHASGTDPRRADFGRLDTNPSRGFHAVKQRPLLFEYILSFVENVYEHNDFSSYVMLVASPSGHIIQFYGAPQDIDRLRDQVGLDVECSLREEIAGTNGIGTCVYTHKPVCIQRHEHYNEKLCHLTSYGAPVFDHTNTLAAIIGVFSLKEAFTPFLLSLISNMASAISKECNVYHQILNASTMESSVDTLINTMNYGVVFLDAKGHITRTNSVARYFFLMYEYELIGQHISTFINPQDIDFSKLENNIHQQEVVISSGEIKKFRLLASVYITGSTPSTRSFVLTVHKEQPKAVNGSTTTDHTAKWQFNDIVGTSFPLKEALSHARTASRTNCSILITGESGTGKELVAQAIHNESKYSDGPFIAVNCGAIPKELIESELFGYESGAFTGAKKNGSPGKFEMANGGTIFLDEIGDMPYDLQVVLLRFLQEQEITRIGGKKPIKVNVRVIAATNKNLEEAINNGAFRMDLYYRLNVFNIHVPPLRERGSDVGNLAHYFLQKYKTNSHQAFVGFTPEALNAMENYNWPGNIRELENTIERAVILGRSERIRLDDLPEKIRSCYDHRSQTFSAMAPNPPVRTEPVMIPFTPEETEKDAITRALRSTNGNVTRAAEQLGFSRRTMYRKMKKYSIL